MMEGHIFRFASCQFGQKTAGSPLGSIVRSLARYFCAAPIAGARGAGGGLGG